MLSQLKFCSDPDFTQILPPIQWHLKIRAKNHVVNAIFLLFLPEVWGILKSQYPVLRLMCFQEPEMLILVEEMTAEAM